MDMYHRYSVYLQGTNKTKHNWWVYETILARAHASESYSFEVIIFSMFIYCVRVCVCVRVYFMLCLFIAIYV